MNSAAPKSGSEPLTDRSASDRLDEALQLTFPASDPVAVGRPTSTEALQRPQDREAPTISADDVADVASTQEDGEEHAGSDAITLLHQHWAQIIMLPWAFAAAAAATVSAWSLAPWRRSESEEEIRPPPDSSRK